MSSVKVDPVDVAGMEEMISDQRAQARTAIIQLAVASLKGALGEIKFDCRTKGATAMFARQLIARVEDTIRDIEAIQ